MTNRAEMTAAPVDVRIGERAFRVSPLTDRDIGELDNYLRSKVVRIARESLPANASEADRQLTMRAAVNESLSISWLSHCGQELRTIDGIARWLWQILHREHPDLTIDDVSRLATDNPGDVREALDVFTALCAGGPTAARASMAATEARAQKAMRLRRTTASRRQPKRKGKRKK